MKHLFGLMSGAVLQRKGDLCEAIFSAEITGLPHTSLGQLAVIGEDNGITKLVLTGIATGGPYTLTLSDEEDSVTLENLYVGDVWMLAGQSNMDGVGYFSDVASEYTPNESIRSLSHTDQEWILAHPNCHRNHLSPHPYMNRFVGRAQTLYQPRGVGPGFFFAEEMYRRTGVPQGILPCALGGSSMAQWDPRVDTEEGNLYTIAIHRLHAAGGRMRGIFWYQGCSETGPGAADIFVENMQRMIAAFRAEAADPAMPFVQVQINRYVCVSEDGDPAWNAIRELQRILSDHIPHLDTVSTVGYTMADGIHLDSPSQKKLGIQAAESMFHLCFDRAGVCSRLAPTLEQVFVCSDPTRFGAALAIRFGNVHGSLTATGVPTGFALSTRPDRIDRRHIFRTDLSADTVYLRHEIPADQLSSLYLSYFFGNNTYANITDSADRPIPAFGPIPLSEWLNRT